MKNKKTTAVRKRCSDLCALTRGSPHRRGAAANRSTRSLNDIATSPARQNFETPTRSSSSKPRVLRRQSACVVDDENECVTNGAVDFRLPCRRRSKRIVDFDDSLDEPPSKVDPSSVPDTAAFSRARKTSRSTTDVVSEKRNYPLLRSQMSDPGDSTGLRPRSGKKDSSGKSLMDFTGNEPQAVSYSVFGFKGNFDPLSCSCPLLSMNGFSSSSNLRASGQSLEDSWKSMYAAMVTSQAMGQAAVPVRNPNKAVLTLEYPSTKILIGNDAAHRLFAVGHDQLVGHRLTDMIIHPSTIFQRDVNGPLAENGDTVNGPSIIDRSSLSPEPNDQLTKACGKVIEIKDALSAVSPAAIWLYPLNQYHSSSQDGAALNRCLAVLEPVERISASCTLGPKGRIFACDEYVADMFGYQSSTEILGSPITELVPALVLPTSKHNTELFRQNLTGRYRNGASFPVTVKLLPEFDADSVVKYEVNFYVYTTISGLITVLPNGVIHSFNNHFVATMFGLRPECLDEKDITTVIPKFYSETGAFDGDVSFNSLSMDENSLNSPIYLRFPELSLNERGCWPSTRHESDGANSLRVSRPGHSPTSTTSATINGQDRDRTSTIGMNGDAGLDDVARPFSSTPTPFGGPLSPIGINEDTNYRSEEDSRQISEGSFFGFGLHRDGSLFGIGYQIRRLSLKDGSVLYCIWVVRDPEALICHNLTRFGATVKSDASIDKALDLLENQAKGLPASKTALDLESEEKEYIRGDYAQYYDTLQQIGKGAYGCVKMAARKVDGLLVVTKFIRKDRILTDCWMEHNCLGRVPIEIFLLTKLRHENIVEVIDVFQNETHFQVVMEKHGFGMDLFEFIDRHPLIDEKLASYIFRQVVSAVSYLHSLSIVHRDIKDENVIIDEHFRCKVIDFGSAAYFKEGKTFSTICGTIEYCSPEVLTGNRYTGPELEMWSLGILLYTLLYFENPFDSVEETIQANLDPPWEISEGLFHLLSWLLHPVPQNRATISDVERHWWVTQPVDMKLYKFEDIVVINDYRELNPPKYLKDLKTAVSTQTSPALPHPQNTEATS